MNKINRSILAIISIPLIFIIPITTLLFAFIHLLTLKLFGVVMYWIKLILFITPTKLFSRAYENGGIIGKVLSIFGLPFVLVGYIVSSLIGHFGDTQSRAYDICFYESYPFSYSFDTFSKNKKEIIDLKDDAQSTINELIKDQKFSQLISSFKINQPAN